MPPVPRHRLDVPSARWRLSAADLSGVPAARLDDPHALERALRRGVLDVLGHAPRRWLHHRFAPHGVSLVGLAARVRVVLHTWPELHAATLDVWSDRSGGEVAVERCASLLGARAVRLVQPSAVAAGRPRPALEHALGDVVRAE